jgi:hypothetical protein
MTSQNIDLSSWDILYIHTYTHIGEYFFFRLLCDIVSSWTIKCRMTEQLLNDEFKRIWKEEVVVIQRHYPGIELESSRPAYESASTRS